MPEAKVYQCDKTEGLEGEHMKCEHEVRDDDDRAVMVSVTIAALGGGSGGPNRDLRFCRRTHANYWLVRQRVALEPEEA